MRAGNAPKLPKAIRPRWETPDPPGVTGSWGPVIVRWAASELGLIFDPWQEYVAYKAFRHGKDKRFVHRTALYSSARQNGKSVIVRAFFGWLLDVGRHQEPFCHWTDIRTAAHDAKQARIIYKAVYQDLARIPRLTKPGVPDMHNKREPATVRLSRQIGIETDSLFFDTLTSEPGSARGLSIGALAFDEILTQRDHGMMEAVGPTQSVQVSPIALLTSTAGFADSVVLRDLYDSMRRQAAGDEASDHTFYGAWWESEDPDAGLDWSQIRQANPSPRLPREAIVSEYRRLPSDSWRRERLNHFVDAKAAGAFNPGVWAACRVSGPLDGLAGPYALGIDVQPGWERATICVAGLRPDGRVGVEVYRDLRATEREPITVERILQEVDAFPDPVKVIAYEEASGLAPTFARHALESSSDAWDPLKPSAVVSACMDVDEMILSRRLAVDDPLLDAQIPLVAQRPVGQDGAFRFSRRASLGPIDAVMAMTFAAHAIAYTRPVNIHV
jgi:hypothetical protein